jgi:hypothetical protein
MILVAVFVSWHTAREKMERERERERAFSFGLDGDKDVKRNKEKRTADVVAGSKKNRERTHERARVKVAPGRVKTVIQVKKPTHNMYHQIMTTRARDDLAFSPSVCNT